MERCPSQVELQLLARNKASSQQSIAWFAHVELCAVCGKAYERLLQQDPILFRLQSMANDNWLSTTIARQHLPQGEAFQNWRDTDTHMDDLMSRMTALYQTVLLTEPLPEFQASQLPHWIAGYRMLGLLGSGGMSNVLRAEDERLKRQIALKLIRPDRVNDPSYLLRFKREAEAIARIDHPNILRIYEYGQYEAQPYLALELITGGSLADWMDGKPIDAYIAAQLTLKLSDGLAAAHEQGIVHRDLKPANILLQKCNQHEIVDEDEHSTTAGPANRLGKRDAHLLATYEPKISDFGLAKRLDEVAVTQTGELLGTPAYMAPELTRGQRLDRETLKLADVYALGAILYELMTGRTPFVAMTVADTFELLRNSEPLAPRQLLPKLPRDLETICLKCLNKVPKERYVSAKDLYDELRRFLAHQPIHARPVSFFHRVWKWSLQRPALSSLLAGLTATVLAAVVGGSIYQYQLEKALNRAQVSEAKAQQSRVLATQSYLSARSSLESMLKVIEDPALSDLPRMRQLQRRQLETALQFYEQVAGSESVDDVMLFDAARAALDAARLQEFLGLTTEAHSNYVRAFERLYSLAESAPGEVKYAVGVADALLGRAGIESERRDFERSIATTHEAIEALASFAIEPIPIPIIEARVRLLHFLGAVLMKQRNTRTDEVGMQLVATALKYSRAAHDLLLSLVDQEPENRQRLDALARTQINLSTIYQQFPEFANQSREFHALAKRSLEELLKSDPQDIAVASNLAILTVNWAFVQEEEGKLEEAIADLETCICRLEPMYVKESDHIAARDALYRAHGVRAQALDALDRYEQSHVNWEGCVKYSPDSNTHRVSWAYALARSGRWQQAQEQLRLDSLTYGPQPPAANLWWAVRTNLAGALWITKNLDTAMAEQDTVRTQCIREATRLFQQLREIASPEQWKSYTEQATPLAEFEPLL